MAKKLFDTVAFPDVPHTPTRVRGSHITSMHVQGRNFSDRPSIHIIVAEARGREYIVHISDTEANAVAWMKENFK